MKQVIQLILLALLSPILERQDLDEQGPYFTIQKPLIGSPPSEGFYSHFCSPSFQASCKTVESIHRGIPVQCLSDACGEMTTNETDTSDYKVKQPVRDSPTTSTSDSKYQLTMITEALRHLPVPLRHSMYNFLIVFCGACI